MYCFLCKFGCNSMLTWSAKYNKPVEASTGLCHEKERCQNIKKKMIARMEPKLGAANSFETLEWRKVKRKKGL